MKSEVEFPNRQGTSKQASENEWSTIWSDQQIIGTGKIILKGNIK